MQGKISNITNTAEVVEVFSSLQGEGPYIGERMTFVRFGRCSMRCSFCDTPQGLCEQKECAVESPHGSGKFKMYQNPITATKLSEILTTFNDHTVSITGGEPLEQVRFLESFLPHLSGKRHILLETNGVMCDELLCILPYVHVVSMDFKLPSSSGVRACWQEHHKFLNSVIAHGKEVYVKIVVTADTTDYDLQKAIGVLTLENKFIPVVIQPVSNTLTFKRAVSSERLMSVERLCNAYLPDVRVIPQMHKVWGCL